MRRARRLSARIAVLALVVSCTVTCGTIVVASSASNRTAAPAPRGSVEWERCGGDFECGTVTVPVDHADPAAGELALAVIRRPADDPDARIGTLVVNFGGPGDAGTETLLLAAPRLPRAITRRFDLVSFDPRGTGSSRPVACVDDATFERAWSEDPTPDGAEELSSFYDGTRSVDLVAACITRHGDWLARLGTRNVARDLDRIRAALGEDRLSYLGYSYGTVLGAVYAQEFPDRVRAMVLDSAVDLTSSMADKQHGQTAGFEGALTAFLDDCAADDACAFHSDGNPRAALEELRTRFEQGLLLDAADGRRVGVAEFYGALVAALYSRAQWPSLAKALRSAALDDDGADLQLFSDIYAGRRPDGTYSSLHHVLQFIVCDDRQEPLVSYEQFVATYAALSSEYPFFGPLFGARPAGCDPRAPTPRADEAVGDVRVTEALPVLVVGATDDPATPFAGARDLQERIADSRLLRVDDTSHGSYGSGNACVDRVVNRVLVSARVPARDRRC